MSKKFRDWLFIFFIAFFIVGTLLISLYASGFQINLSWPLNFNRLLIKTGMLVIKTKPEGATIYLNQKAQANFSINPWKKINLTTDARLKNILPGTYNLNLELKGYLPLTKRITVSSGQTTFLENINLFKSDLPQLLVRSPETKLQLSNNHQYLYLATPAEILNPQSSKITKLKLIITSRPGQWLNNNNQLFINGQLFSLKQQSSINYQQILGSAASNLYYDESTNRLYYQNGHSLNYFDIRQRKSFQIISGEDYLNYQVQNDRLFVVALKNQKTVLQLYSLADNKLKQEINLPSDGHYLFVANQHNRLSLYDTKNETLYLINPQILHDQKIIYKILSWQWINDQTLFYNNDWEIYKLNLQKNQSMLLTRVGEKIVKIIWNKNNKYLVFSTTNSLNTYDPKINLITKLFTGNAISSPVLDNNNNTLYFWAKIGRQSGIYSIVLQ